MSDRKKPIRAYLSPEAYAEIESLAKKKEISVSSAAGNAIEFYLNHKDEDLDSHSLIERIENLLRDALSDQNKMIDKELKYMRSISNQSSEDSFTYIHLMNSFLWKLNMSESDYCNATENTNPVMRLAVSDGNRDAARYRESRITNNEKYGKQ